jgi:type I restriction enzyme S subunit
MSDPDIIPNCATVGSLFSQVSTPVNPAAFPNENFLHYSLPAYDEFGGPVLHRGVDIESNKTLLQRDSILVSKLNPRKPRVQLVRKSTDFRQVSSTEFIALVLRNNQSDLGYFKHLLNSYPVQGYLDSVATGTTNSHVRARPSDLLKRRVFAPPIREQRRIAEILDALDDQIRATEQIITKLRLTKHGLLNALLTCGIDKSGNLRDPVVHPELFANHEALSAPMSGKIPEGWSVGPIGEWCDRMTVGVVNSATHAYVDDGIPFIRSQNVKPGRIDLRGMLHITDAYNAQQSSSILRADDVVVVRTGYPGTAAVVPKELSGANCFSLLVVTPRRSALISDYLALYLNSELGSRQIGRLHFGSAQHNFNLAELKQLPILVPPPTEQGAIVGAARSVENLISEEQAVVDKLRLQKSGLMSDLLTGRVRVPTEVRS